MSGHEVVICPPDGLDADDANEIAERLCRDGYREQAVTVRRREDGE